MPNTPFGKLDPDADLEAVKNYIIRLERKLDYIINGGVLDSQNMFEVGGWRVTADQLASKDGDVGMSTEDTPADDVRFWAGGTDKNNAPWRVYESGKGLATGLKIQSSTSGYPRFEIDPDTQEMTFYASADNYVRVGASTLPSGNSFIQISYQSNVFYMFYETVSSEFVFVSNDDFSFTANSMNLFASAINIASSAINIASSAINIASWSVLRAAGQTLQQALDAKATKNVSTGSAGGHGHGIPDGAWIKVYNSIGDEIGMVQYSHAPNHTHNQN
jgi:hypothetical protein